MDPFEHVDSLARGCGKTTALAEACRSIGAKLIVHSREEAKRIVREYGVDAVSMDNNLRSHRGPFLVDLPAIARYAWSKNRKINEQANLIRTMSAELDKLKQELEMKEKGE